uniref:Uncharacterized protein n=1 Tax=Lygus hesperus TaxID=30085 RepID=A0A146KTW8_LYGHE
MLMHNTETNHTEGDCDSGEGNTKGRRKKGAGGGAATRKTSTTANAAAAAAAHDSEMSRRVSHRSKVTRLSMQSGRLLRELSRFSLHEQLAQELLIEMALHTSFVQYSDNNSSDGCSSNRTASIVISTVTISNDRVDNGDNNSTERTAMCVIDL